MPRSPSTASNLRVLITTGDPDGVGWEVTAKALAQLGPRPAVQFTLFRSADVRTLRPAFPRGFRRRTVKSLAEATALPDDPRDLIEIISERPAARWVEEAAHACVQGTHHALVTAPLSKTSVLAAGLSEIGHTEILARVSGARDLFMGFIGAKFCVVLATGHQSLSRAARAFDEATLRQALAAARTLREALPPARRARPLAVVGLNPHAGEAGLLGDEETWMARVIAETSDVNGPLVPDAAFLPKMWPQISAYVCPYHDQGLIPFKLVHGFKGGVHLTLGLPFVRTSVDHGTAKELFGKNLAESGSMKDAIVAAVRLSKEKFR